MRAIVESSEMMAAQQLRSRIREASPAIRYYGPVTTCRCEECTHIREELRHKLWDEIPTEFLDFTCSPTLLSPEAFHAFLAAYLLRALDDLSGHSVVLELTVYSLCPDIPDQDAEEGRLKMDRLSQRARLMSPSQIQAIKAFLQFVQENAGAAKWFRPFITSALENVWR